MDQQDTAPSVAWWAAAPLVLCEFKHAERGWIPAVIAGPDDQGDLCVWFRHDNSHEDSFRPAYAWVFQKDDKDAVLRPVDAPDALMQEVCDHQAKQINDLRAAVSIREGEARSLRQRLETQAAFSLAQLGQAGLELHSRDYMRMIESKAKAFDDLAGRLILGRDTQDNGLTNLQRNVLADVYRYVDDMVVGGYGQDFQRRLHALDGLANVLGYVPANPSKLDPDNPI